MKIDEIFNYWLDTKVNLVTPHTAKSYISAYDVHILPNFGDSDIHTIKYIDYQNFANKLLRSGRKPKTVKNILSILGNLYRFAIKNDWYDGRNYPEMVDLPVIDNKFYVPFDAELQRQYLIAVYHFDELIYRDMFLMLLHGRRLGEVLNLEWQYVDLKSGLVYYPPEKNKSRRHRTYRLTDFMIKILREYHAREIELQGTPFVTGYVFYNPKTGKPFANLAKPWRRLLKAKNLPYTKLHSIRHILGTYLINELKFPITDVSFMLGHSDVNITMKYYTPSPDLAKDCTQALVDSFRDKKDIANAKLLEIVGMGKHIEATLFSPAKLHKVNS